MLMSNNQSAKVQSKTKQISNNNKKVQKVKRRKKSGDLALTCNCGGIIVLLWYVRGWYSYAMLLKSSFYVGRKHR